MRDTRRAVNRKRRGEKQGEKHGKWRVKTAVVIGEKTFRKARWLRESCCLRLGKKTRAGLAHAIFPIIRSWLGAEERRTGGGQREETGRGWMTARSMPNNIIWMSEGTRPGCQAQRHEPRRSRLRQWRCNISQPLMSKTRFRKRILFFYQCDIRSNVQI